MVLSQKVWHLTRQEKTFTKYNIMKFYIHKNEWWVILPYTMSNHKEWKL